jgi:hypothetical protein
MPGLLASLLLALQVASVSTTPAPTPLPKAGPVISTNFQGPSLMQFNGTYYAIAGVNGNPTNINVQLATSTDFSTWSVAYGYDVLPTLASWATEPSHLWAPDLNQLPDAMIQSMCRPRNSPKPFSGMYGKVSRSSILSFLSFCIGHGVAAICQFVVGDTEVAEMTQLGCAQLTRWRASSTPI